MSLAYNLLWVLFKLPKDDELIALVGQFLNHYGLWIVFISAFIEGVLIAGNYFPGGLVVFLGVLASGNNIPKVAFVVFLVVLAFACSYCVNYVLGRYGWYKLLVKFGLSAQLETAKKKLEQHSFKAIVFSYWHPNVGALISTSAGILKMDFIKFISESLPILLFWNAFWGALVFFLGKQALNLVLSLKYIVPIAIIWLIIIWVKEKYFHAHGTVSQ
jgi:membrane protein DedA with SNARE-associated domain